MFLVKFEQDGQVIIDRRAIQAVPAFATLVAKYNFEAFFMLVLIEHPLSPYNRDRIVDKKSRKEIAQKIISDYTQTKRYQIKIPIDAIGTKEYDNAVKRFADIEIDDIWDEFISLRNKKRECTERITNFSWNIPAEGENPDRTKEMKALIDLNKVIGERVTELEGQIFRKKVNRMNTATAGLLNFDDIKVQI